MNETCPNRDRLRAVLTGSVSADENAAISRHVENCETCQKTLDELARSSWDEKARQVQAVESPDSALQEVMQQALGQATIPESHPEPAAGRDGGLDFLTAADQPGHLKRLAHYEILELVGKGGFGTVFKARDETLDRVVAIKVLTPPLANNATARKRFIREAKAAAAVSHDHLVGIHAVEESNGVPYIVMQFIHGISLQDRLDRSGPLELKEILRVGMQIASGLAAAHAQGLVHRDIKPANILLENGIERVKITDFGLARLVDDASISQSGVVAGTPMYMAPEQAAGEHIDHRADLFSLGSVLYVMSTGRPPFRASGTLAVMKRVVEETPRPIREINPEIPDWLECIIGKLHAKKPEDRFQSAKEVAELLEQHLAHLQHPSKVPLPPMAKIRIGPLHTITTRTPAADEQRLIAGRAKFDFASYGCITILFAILPAYLLGILGGWLGGFISPEAATYGQWIGWALAALVFVASIVSFIPYERRQRQRAEQDHRAQIIQDIHVVEPRVLEIALVNDNEPILAFQIGENKILYLQGQWLRDYETYGVDDSEREPYEEFLNGLPAPHSFPSSEFTLSRLPNSGEVLGIRVAGRYLAPGAAVAALKPEYEFADSELLDGSLDDIAGVLAREYARRDGDPIGDKPLPPVEKLSGTLAADPLIAGAIQRLKTPAIGLLVTGLLYWATIPMVYLAGLLEGVPENQSTFLWIVDCRRGSPSDLAEVHTFLRRTLVLWPALVGFLLIFGAWKMRRCELYSLALATACLPFLLLVEKLVNLPWGRFAMGPGDFTALPFGLWALIVLSRQDVRAAFARKKRFQSVQMLAGATPSTTNPSRKRRVLVQATALLALLALTVYFGPWLLGVIRNTGYLWVSGDNATTAKLVLSRDGQAVKEIKGLGLQGFELPPGDYMCEANYDKTRWDCQFELTTDSWFGLWGKGEIKTTDRLEFSVGRGDRVNVSVKLMARQPLKPQTDALDEDRIQGKWIAVAGEFQCTPLPDLKKIVMTFTRAKVELLNQGGKTERGTFNLDPRKTPKQIIIEDTDKNYWMRGIYKLEGDRLIVAMGKTGTPTEFKTTAASPWMLLELKHDDSKTDQAFVILAKDAKSEQKFATLAEAVAAAQSGDTIEICGNGPFVNPPFFIRKALTIQAGQGFRPVMKMSLAQIQDASPLFETSAPLVLEGLHLERIGIQRHQSGPLPKIVVAQGAPVRVANCRFIAFPDCAAIWADSSPVCEVRNCELLRDGQYAGVDHLLPRGGRLILDNNVMLGGDFGIAFHFGRPDLADVAVEATRNTLLTGIPIGLCLDTIPPSKTDAPAKPIRLTASANIFDARVHIVELFQSEHYLAMAKPLDAKNAQAVLGRLAVWSGQNNVYAEVPTLLGTYVKSPEPLPVGKSLAEWHLFWGTKDTSAVRGKILYKGGDLWSRVGSKLEHVTPEDFRLAAGSPGKGASPAGKDLGADVDLVGPGPAYERWKKTSDYREWRKKTEQSRKGK